MVKRGLPSSKKHHNSNWIYISIGILILLNPDLSSVCIVIEVYKNRWTIKIELPLEFLHERSNNYDWPIRACLVDL